jgi:hypothetical protein
MSYMEAIESLKSKFGSFVLDAEAGASNKSAALRARKLSMDLRRELGEFRKASVANDRANVKHHAPQAEATPAETPAQ